MIEEHFAKVGKMILPGSGVGGEAGKERDNDSAGSRNCSGNIEVGYAGEVMEEEHGEIYIFSG